MKHSTNRPLHSCKVSESFDATNLTAFGGANLLVDFVRQDIDLFPALTKVSVQKAPNATYTVAQDLECLLMGYMLGMKRVFHMDQMEHDPLLTLKLNLKKLPQYTTLYRTLDRFEKEDDVASLHTVNRHTLEHILHGNSDVTLDIDTTVEPVHGEQEGSSIGYNPRYHGRASYQPFVAFDGNTKAAVHAQLRSGDTPNADDKVAFYNAAKEQLPKGCAVKYCRADRAFASEQLFSQLEKDGVKYAIKRRMTSSLMKHMNHYARWEMVWIDDYVEIDSASVNFRSNDWSKARRVVIIRTKRLAENAIVLFPEYTWEYEAIVTNLNWDGQDVWDFYNQRCTCENYIKELKYGLHIDSISKDAFWPNAADLIIKIIAYNLLVVLRSKATSACRKYSVERFRRMILCIPGILVRHARQWRLRMPVNWRDQEAWRQLRSAIA